MPHVNGCGTGCTRVQPMTAQLEQLKPDALVQGLVGREAVRAVTAEMLGAGCPARWCTAARPAPWSSSCCSAATMSKLKWWSAGASEAFATAMVSLHCRTHKSTQSKCISQLALRQISVLSRSGDCICSDHMDDLSTRSAKAYCPLT